MNNYEKQRKKKKIILVTTIAIVLFSTVSLFIRRKGTNVERMLRDSVAFVEYYVIKKPISFVGDLINEYSSLKDVYEENKILEKELKNYTNSEAQMQMYEKELEELKKLFKIENLPHEYTRKVTEVATRSQESWSQEIIIALGSAADVEVGMAVITSEGMIGTVTDVSSISATVSLLTNEKMTNQIPVQVLNGDQVLRGLMKGYNVEKNCYEVEMLDEIETLTPEAPVQTSGMGANSKCPKGLMIGTALELGTSDDGITRTLYVKPAADFKNFSYVAVVFKGANSE